MAQYKDYYKILGVSKNASEAEIKKAFKTAARKYHPDLQPDSKKAEMTEKFKDVNEAYEVLSDKKKRDIYDQVGSADYQNYARGGGTGGAYGGTRTQRGPNGSTYYYSSGGNPFGGGAGGFNFNGTGGFDASDFSDFFQSIFGGGFGGGNPFGGGRRKQSRAQDPYGYYGQDQTEQANLSLSLPSAYRGGLVNLTLPNGNSAQVKFPARITDGAKIKLKGLGSNGGDLYVNIKLAADPFYKVENNDIYYVADIMPWTAALGGQVSVPLPDATRITIKVPPQSRSGQKLKLSGKGLGKSGNFYVQLMINNPAHLTSKQKELFEKLQETAI
ncbi:MAG: DnaJ domain-containing protein [Elusimicrobiaceae bacterium]|nr:DnaJ domain-containing protein [Elusimicrobiaceae bacterium]